MLLTQTATASPPKSEQARPEPFMADTAAKYERSFLDVLNKHIDLSKNQTYMAAESKDLLSNKLTNFPLNQFKYDNAFTMDNFKSGAVFIESGSSDGFKTADEPFRPLTAETGSKALKSSGKTEQTENDEMKTQTGEAGSGKTVEKKDEAGNEKDAEEDGAKKEEEKTAEDIEKYLQDIFTAKLNIKVSFKKGEAGGELSVKGLSDGQNASSVKEFLTRIEAMLKKQFPQAKLSQFNIEMIKVSAHQASIGVQKPGGETISPNATSLLASKMSMTKALEKDGRANDGNKHENGGSSNRENAQFLSLSADGGVKSGAGMKESLTQQAQKFDQAKMLEQIKSHLNESKFSSSNGTYSIKMILRPEELGRINLEMVMKDGQLSAKFKADNPATIEMLNASVEQLKEMLNEKGIKVVNVEFGNYDGGFGGGEGSNGENSGRGNDSWNERNGGGSKNSEGNETFEFAETNGGKNTSVFILSDKKVNVRV
jgi:flagellar hook-length control protein FliK